MTSADTLRRAATLMRERADAAICPCGGPVCTITHGGIHLSEMTDRLEGSEHAAAHYAAWRPAVAVAVADWLDGVADRSAIFRDAGFTIGQEAVAPALAVARAYLGEDA